MASHRGHPFGCHARTCSIGVRFSGNGAFVFRLATHSDVIPGLVPLLSGLSPATSINPSPDMTFSANDGVGTRTAHPLTQRSSPTWSGIQYRLVVVSEARPKNQENAMDYWIPACAGMTSERVTRLKTEATSLLNRTAVGLSRQ